MVQPQRFNLWLNFPSFAPWHRRLGSPFGIASAKIVGLYLSIRGFLPNLSKKMKNLSLPHSCLVIPLVIPSSVAIISH